MKWQSVDTRKGTRCRVLEGGSGAPLVFFHSAGGLLHDNPFLDRLAQTHHVFAPEWPGYGESTGEELLEDMLDFALHGWDVIDALGLRRPHLVGHSMGGMIAAEMACLAPRDLGKLVLAAPAGVWLDEHPIPDIFALLPFQLAEVLFHDPQRGQMLMTGGADLSDIEALKDFYLASQRRLAMAGNLVLQGRADGVLAAYRATDGKQLWSFDAGTGIMAPPVTYQVDGVQYVSVLAGWGGPDGLGNDPNWGPVKPGFGRILTFTLGGNAAFKPPAFGHKGPPPMPTIKVDASPQLVRQGEQLFGENCAGCHGGKAIAGPLPDLRYASAQTLEGIQAIVLGGARASRGMPSFQKILNADQVKAIQAYIVARAREDAGAAGKSSR